ncbi:hypothetical protein ACOME3_010026 [Neoechinorhynchus agilis]
MSHSSESSVYGQDELESSIDTSSGDEQNEEIPSENPEQSNAPELKRYRRMNNWGPESFAELIEKAIQSSEEKRLRLREIYSWFMDNIPYFAERSDLIASKQWKNSIRHNLSLHKRFKRIFVGTTLRVSYWTVDQNNHEEDHQNSDRKRSNPNLMDDAENKWILPATEFTGPVNCPPFYNNQMLQHSNVPYLGYGTNNNTNLINSNQQFDYFNVASNAFGQNGSFNLGNNEVMAHSAAIPHNYASNGNMNIGIGYQNLNNTILSGHGTDFPTIPTNCNSQMTNPNYCMLNCCVDPTHGNNITQYVLLPFCQRCSEIQSLNTGIFITEQQAMAALGTYKFN